MTRDSAAELAAELENWRDLLQDGTEGGARACRDTITRTSAMLRDLSDRLASTQEDVDSINACLTSARTAAARDMREAAARECVRNVPQARLDGVDLLSCGHLYTRPLRDLPGDVPKGKKRRCALCAADTVEDRRRAYERRYYRSGAKTKSRCPHYVQQRSAP